MYLRTPDVTFTGTREGLTPTLATDTRKSRVKEGSFDDGSVYLRRGTVSPIDSGQRGVTPGQGRPTILLLRIPVKTGSFRP